MSARDDLILAFDPWAGDFGDGEVTLSDKMVVTRKEHVCHICAGGIVVGERVRSLTEVCDGDICTTRFCALCCDGMAADDNGILLEARYAIGDQRRAALSSAREKEEGS